MCWGSALKPQAPNGWVLLPQAPETAPPVLEIFGYVPVVFIAAMFFCVNCFLQLAGVYGFPQTGLSWNNFTLPCSSDFYHYSISAQAQREEKSVLNFV